MPQFIALKVDRRIIIEISLYKTLQKALQTNILRSNYYINVYCISYC